MQICQSFKFQAIPQLIKEYDAEIYCYSAVHSDAIKSIFESLALDDGTKVFKNIEYINWNPPGIDIDTVAKERRCLPLHFCHDLNGLPAAIAERSFLLGNMYEFVFNTPSLLPIPDDYVCIHPTGGTRIVDGLPREDYSILIEKIIKELEENVVVVGASHTRSHWTTKTTEVLARFPEFVENPLYFAHPKFFDLTNRLSAAQCAKVVKKAKAFVGTHSVWINYFWHFRKPSICVMSESSGWGHWTKYLEVNGCRWGFYLPWCRVVPVAGIHGDPNLIESQSERYDKYASVDSIVRSLLWS